MPTTVTQLFDHIGVKIQGEIQWGTQFVNRNQGIYVVALNNIVAVPDFNEGAIKSWINKIPYFQIDNKTPTLTLLKERLNNFWLNNEKILYIGKACRRGNGDGLSKRISEYFKTEIADKSPHSGGQWIKTIKMLNDATIFYGYTDDPGDAEIKMLDFFMRNISSDVLDKLFDKNYPLPFANIRYKGRIDKKHGLTNQRLK